MADPIVISSLKAKRAELDGELMETEKRAARLRADLDAIDRAIKVFDPTIELSRIRPIVRRARPKLFAHGHFSRVVLDVLRRADRPLTLKWTPFLGPLAKVCGVVLCRNGWSERYDEITQEV